MGMIIPQIIRIFPFQPPIPLTPLPLPILPHIPNQKRQARRRTEPHQPETNPIASRVCRFLAGDEDIRGHDTTSIAETDLTSYQLQVLYDGRVGEERLPSQRC